MFNWSLHVRYTIDLEDYEFIKYILNWATPLNLCLPFLMEILVILGRILLLFTSSIFVVSHC